MNAPAAPAIDFDAVSFAFGDVPVLQDVSLQVGAREFCALIGPNGGGKSTLVKLALGLLAPDAGTVRVLGTTPQQARRRIGYVPQFATFPKDFQMCIRDRP